MSTYSRLLWSYKAKVSRGGAKSTDMRHGLAQHVRILLAMIEGVQVSPVYFSISPVFPATKWRNVLVLLRGSGGEEVFARRGFRIRNHPQPCNHPQPFAMRALPLPLASPAKAVTFRNFKRCATPFRVAGVAPRDIPT